MVRICRWILCAPTDFAETPGAYRRPCFPVNSFSARTTRQVGLLWWLLSSGMICVTSGSWDPAFLSKSHRPTPASRRLQTVYQTRRCSCGQEFGDRLDALDWVLCLRQKELLQWLPGKWRARGEAQPNQGNYHRSGWDDFSYLRRLNSEKAWPEKYFSRPDHWAEASETASPTSVPAPFAAIRRA
jgi:hypothetical protein